MGLYIDHKHIIAHFHLYKELEMNIMTPHNIKKLKSLVKLSPTIKGLLNWLAAREKATWNTKVRVASQNTGLRSRLLKQAFLQLQELGFGTFKGAANGLEARFEWDISSKQVALSALG
jgi:hypothetical protein